MILVLLLVVASVLGAQCTLPPAGPAAGFPPPATVTWCAGSLRQASVRAQFLADDSASMNGFPAAMPVVAQWVELAFSHLRGSITQYAARRSCYFSQGRGIHDCSSSALAVKAFRAQGNTSLDQAIREAANFDLSVVLTDGIAATGATGGQGCAAGVDASCVAGSLEQAIAPRAGDPQAMTPGIWLVPLAASFDGRFYTEQRADPSSFDTGKAAAAVAAETSTVAEITAPGLDAAKQLAYRYRGPRLLLLLVVARDANLGRGFVQALAARREPGGLAALDALKAFQAGVAALPPIEVYPGVLPQWRFTGWKPEIVGGRRLLCGTVGVNWDNSGLRVSCPAGTNGIVGRMIVQETPSGAGCTALKVAPQIRVSATEFPGEPRLLEAARWEGRPVPVLLAKLGCSGDWKKPCGSSYVQWSGTPDYKATADCLSAAGGCGSAPVQAIAALSTAQLAYQPHRILGLKDTVVSFYQRVAGQTRAIPFLRLDICKGQ